MMIPMLKLLQAIVQALVAQSILSPFCALLLVLLAASVSLSLAYHCSV
jgi:hypothetical protein